MPYGHQKEQTETTVFQPHQLRSNSSTIIVNIMYKMVYIGVYTILCLYCEYICILWGEKKTVRRASKTERGREKNACSVLFVAWISWIVFVIYHATTVTYNAMRASQAFYTVFISFSSWCSYSSLHLTRSAIFSSTFDRFASLALCYTCHLCHSVALGSHLIKVHLKHFHIEFQIITTTKRNSTNNNGVP